MIRINSIKFLSHLIRLSELKIDRMNEQANGYIARREYQINKWKNRILEIERESMYKTTIIGFKITNKKK